MAQAINSTRPKRPEKRNEHRAHGSGQHLMVGVDPEDYWFMLVRNASRDRTHLLLQSAALSRPARMTPATLKKWYPRSLSISGVGWMGSQTPFCKSGPRLSGNRKLAGITPTTVLGLPPIFDDLSTMFGSE